MTDTGQHDEGTGPPPPQSPSRSGGRGISAGQVVAGILFVLVVIFIFENEQHVSIRIIAGPKVSVPLSLALLLSAVVGAIVTALVVLRRQRRKRRG